MKLKLALLLVTVALAVRAADTPASGINIDADGSAFFIPTNGAMLILITNNVRATEGQTLLTCDLLSILTRSSGTNTQTFASLPDTSGFGTDLQSITAEGQVVIKDENGRATGDKAVFDQSTGILTLSGSRNLPMLESADGKSRLTAKSEKTVIIFDRKTRITSCVGPFTILGSTPTSFLSLPGTSTQK